MEDVEECGEGEGEDRWEEGEEVDVEAAERRLLRSGKYRPLALRDEANEEENDIERRGDRIQTEERRRRAHALSVRLFPAIALETRKACNCKGERRCEAEKCACDHTPREGRSQLYNTH